MKISINKNRILTAALMLFFALAVTYLLFRVCAPHLLQRWGLGLLDMFVPQTRALRLATAGREGHYYRLGSLIRDELEDGYGYSVALLPSRGSLENIELIQNGEADFALIQGALQVEMAGLTAVANMGPQYVHIVVPADSPIREFRDLAGKKVNLGPSKSGFAALGGLILDYYHFSPSELRIHTELMSGAELDAGFQSGDWDALFTVFRMHAPLIEAILETGRYRLIPLTDAPAVSATIPGSQATNLPNGLYGPDRKLPPEGAPFPTLSVNTLLVTRADHNALDVHNILQILYTTRFVKKSNHLELVETHGRKIFDLPLHSAAHRFYSRHDPVTADRFEIASFFIASLVFAGGLANHLVRRFKARRTAEQRKQIVPYFEELLRFSRKLAREEDIETLRESLADMMSTQRRAEKEWLAGKLDTEHMENLYAIYGIRTANAFNKMMQTQLLKNQELLEKALQRLEALGKERRGD